MKSYKKIFYVLVSVLILAVVLGTAVVVVAPRIINSEGVKAKIQTLLKKKIGGNVAYHELGFSLFPIPAVHISAITVAKPNVISGKISRATVYPEIVPLFTGNVNVKKIHLYAPDFKVFFDGQKKREEKISLENFAMQMPRQLKIIIDDGSLAIINTAGKPIQIKKINARITPRQKNLHYKLSCAASVWKKLEMEGSINPQLFRGEGRVEVEGFQPRAVWNNLSGQSGLSLEEAVVDLSLAYNLIDKVTLDAKISGSLPRLIMQDGAKKLIMRGIRFSGSLEKQKDRTAFQLRQLDVNFPRVALVGRLVIDSKSPRVRLALSGQDLQVETVREIGLFFAENNGLVRDIFYPFRDGVIPKANFSVAGEKIDDLTLFNRMNIAFSLRDGKVAFFGEEQHQITAFQTDVVIKNGNLFMENVKAQKDGSVLTARRADLTFGEIPDIKISDGQATLFAEDFHDFFQIIGLEPYLKAGNKNISGRIMFPDLQITGPLLRPKEWQIDTKGEIQNARLAIASLRSPVEISHAVLQANWDRVAQKNKINIPKARGVLNEEPLSLSGDVAYSLKGVDFDLQVEADRLNFNTLTAEREEEEVPQKTAAKDTFWDVPLSGKLDLRSGYVVYDKYKFADVQADIFLTPRSIEVKSGGGELCTISINGEVQAGPRNVTYNLKPVAQGQDIGVALSCLFGDKAKLSGKYSLTGELSGKGAKNEWLDVLQGNFNLHVQGGRVFRSPLLLRIFSLLSLTDVFEGELPQFSEEGFDYKFLRAQADVKGGKIIVKEVVFESKTINLTGEGEIDIQKNKLDMVILATTLDAVNSLLQKIPIIKHITGENLLTYPVKVTGSIGDPKVNFLSPTALGKKVIGIVERTLKLPGEIIKPVMPKTKNNQ